jgi:hypothetical protein
VYRAAAARPPELSSARRRLVKSVSVPDASRRSRELEIAKNVSFRVGPDDDFYQGPFADAEHIDAVNETDKQRYIEVPIGFLLALDKVDRAIAEATCVVLTCPVLCILG